MLDLPLEFIQTIENAFEEKGRRWLVSLPALLKEAVRRWDLTDIHPVPNLSYNFVAVAVLDMKSNVGRRWVQSQPAPAVQPGETLQSKVVLKLGVPQRELTSEIAALRYYNGHGACRLLDADAEKGMLLLERLQPGRMLTSVQDDEHATRIAAQVMRNLWEGRSGFGQSEFIRLKGWFAGFQRLRQRFAGGTGPLPKPMVERAESLSSDLLSENKDETLLHGDFHHYNVLESARGWLAIDPKGVIGPRGYEAGPFLMNPIPSLLNGDNPRSRTEKRIAILSEMLDMEAERIRAWGICHAVLSAWWSFEENDPNWKEYSLRCAEMLCQARV